jgi:hypothetical protein
MDDEIINHDAVGIKEQAKAWPKVAAEQYKELQRSYRGNPDVDVVEWDKLKERFVKDGIAIEELSRANKIKAEVIRKKARDNGWHIKKAKHEAAEAQRQITQLKGLAEAGKRSVKERQSQEKAIDSKKAKAEAIAKSNERTILFLDRSMELMALALGITDTDYELFEQNPALMMGKVKQIAEDKDQNANFVRLFDKLKEAVVLKRLVSGQSTSAANREDPIDSDDQEPVLISLAEVVDGQDSSAVETVALSTDSVLSSDLIDGPVEQVDTFDFL